MKEKKQNIARKRNEEKLKKYLLSKQKDVKTNDKYRE